MSKIKDINLWEEGEQKIAWVEHHMPILRGIGQEFEKEKPFKGLTVALACHLEAKTAYLYRVFQKGGARVIAAGSNPYSTKDDICAALAHGGIEVFARHCCSEEEQKDFLRDALREHPNIIIDDGGDLLELVHSEFSSQIGEILGGCEETTTGVNRLQKMDAEGRLGFPMMMINHADCKHLFDNRYGTGQSCFDAIDTTTNLNVAGKTVVVCGYGWVGKGLALRAKGLGAKVIVTEINPVKAIEAAMDGYLVMKLIDAAPIGDLFITAAGEPHVIRKEHYQVMKGDAVVANAGHFAYEIDIDKLREIAVREYDARENIKGFVMKDGRTIFVIAEGNLVNIAAGNGHPADIMDMSFSLQALNARYIALHSKELGPHAVRVPREIDEEVAYRKLKAMDIEIDN